MMKTLRFRHRGASHTIFKRSARQGAPFYFRFSDESGRRVVRTLDTPEEAEARERAKGILDSLSRGRWDEVDRMVRRKHYDPGGGVLLGELCDLFREHATFVRKAHRRAVPSAMLNLLRHARGMTKETARQLPAAELNALHVRQFFAKRVGVKPAEIDYTEVYPCACGANSTLRQARALFSRKARRLYQEHGIEARPVEFMEAPFLRQPKKRYQDNPIPDSAIEAMNAALPALREDDERLWAIHLLIRCCGLRASEVRRARRHWLVENGPAVRLVISAREGEEAPKRQDGGVRITHPELLDYLLRQEDHLIPARTDTERHNLIYEIHSAWLRQFIPGRQKSNHELRKWAGSKIAEKTGSFEKAALFLRIDIETAKEHYLAFTRDDDLTIGAEDL